MKNVLVRIAVGVIAFLLVRLVIVTAASSYHQRNLDRELDRLRDAQRRTDEAFRRLEGR